jgi:ABC-type spermidine/putrescine transport system permease subunit II
MKLTSTINWQKLLHDKDLWTAVLLWVIIAGVCVVVANVFAAEL